MAQLVERVLGKDEVLGSNPSGSFRSVSRQRVIAQNGVDAIRPMLRNSQRAVGGDAIATHGVVVCGTDVVVPFAVTVCTAGLPFPPASSAPAIPPPAIVTRVASAATGPIPLIGTPLGEHHRTGGRGAHAAPSQAARALSSSRFSTVRVRRSVRTHPSSRIVWRAWATPAREAPVQAARSSWDSGKATVTPSSVASP